MKTIIGFIVLLLVSGCASIPADQVTFRGDFKTPEMKRVYIQQDQYFHGSCPRSIRVSLVDTSSHGRYNTKDNSIEVSSRLGNYMANSTFMHELSHACLSTHNSYMNQIGPYMWVNEGLANYLGRSYNGQEKFIRTISVKISKQFIDSGFVSFEKLQNWDDIFGQTVGSGGGTIGYNAYFFGSSFIMYISDTYGKDAPLKLIDAFGSSLSFNRAIKSAFGISGEELEKNWKDWIRNYKFTPDEEAIAIPSSWNKYPGPSA